MKRELLLALASCASVLAMPSCGKLEGLKMEMETTKGRIETLRSGSAGLDAGLRNFGILYPTQPDFTALLESREQQQNILFDLQEELASAIVTTVALEIETVQLQSDLDRYRSVLSE